MKKILFISCVALLLGVATVMQAQTTSSVVVKKGGKFYCGEQQMNRAAYKQFLQAECPQAYQQYHQGQQCMIAGWALLGGGLAGASFAIPAWFVSGFGNSASPTPSAGQLARSRSLFSSALLFSGAVIVSVPLLSFGYIRMDNRSVKTYNEQCAKQDVELAFGVTGNGVGMTIRF